MLFQVLLCTVSGTGSLTMPPTPIPSWWDGENMCPRLQFSPFALGGAGLPPTICLSLQLYVTLHWASDENRGGKYRSVSWNKWGATPFSSLSAVPPWPWGTETSAALRKPWLTSQTTACGSREEVFCPEHCQPSIPNAPKTVGTYPTMSDCCGQSHKPF